MYNLNTSEYCTTIERFYFGLALANVRYAESVPNVGSLLTQWQLGKWSRTPLSVQL